METIKVKNNNHQYESHYYVTSIGGMDSGESEIIPLPQLKKRPFYNFEGSNVVLYDCVLPISADRCAELGNTPVQGGRLQDYPEAYATALWMLGYFTVRFKHNPELPYVLNRHITHNLKVSDKSVSMAKRALSGSLFAITEVYKKCRNRSYQLNDGSRYQPLVNTLAESFEYYESREFDLPHSEPLTEEEQKSLELSNRRRFQQRAVRPTDYQYTILDQLKKDNAPQYTYTATYKTTLSDTLVDELNNLQVSKTRKMSHGRNAALKADVLCFVDYLQSQYSKDPALTNMFFGEWVDHDKNQYIELGYRKLAQLWGMPTNGKNSDSTVKRRIKEVLREGLGWIEVYQSPSGGTSYRHHPKRAQFARYRFTPEFVEKNGGLALECKSEKIFNTYFKVLSLTTLDDGALKIFKEVAKKRGWNKVTISSQLSKLENFDYKKGRVSQTRANSRITTHVVSLPREFREYLRIDGEEVAEVDLKTAHPFLIANYFEDEQERDRWLEYLSKNDLYTDLANSVPISKEEQDRLSSDDLRDCFKQLVNAYLNGGGINAFNSILPLEVEFSEVIKEKFPYLDSVVTELIETKSDKGKTNGVALELQQSESKIIGSYYMTHPDYLAISTHDGVICKRSDADRIKQDIERRIKEENLLGYPLIINIK